MIVSYWGLMFVLLKWQANMQGKLGFFFGGLAALCYVWAFFRVPEVSISSCRISSVLPDIDFDTQISRLLGGLTKNSISSSRKRCPRESSRLTEWTLRMLNTRPDVCLQAVWNISEAKSRAYPQKEPRGRLLYHCTDLGLVCKSSRSCMNSECGIIH